MSVAVTSPRIGALILSYTFPFLDGNLGATKTVWIYAAIRAAGFFSVKARLPETKGQPLEEIERFWN